MIIDVALVQQLVRRHKIAQTIEILRNGRTVRAGNEILTQEVIAEKVHKHYEAGIPVDVAVSLRFVARSLDRA